MFNILNIILFSIYYIIYIKLLNIFIFLLFFLLDFDKYFCIKFLSIIIYHLFINKSIFLETLIKSILIILISKPTIWKKITFINKIN